MLTVKPEAELKAARSLRGGHPGGPRPLSCGSHWNTGREAGLRSRGDVAAGGCGGLRGLRQSGLRGGPGKRRTTAVSASLGPLPSASGVRCLHSAHKSSALWMSCSKVFTLDWILDWKWEISRHCEAIGDESHLYENRNRKRGTPRSPALVAELTPFC